MSLEEFKAKSIKLVRKETNLENEKHEKIRVGYTLELFEQILRYERKQVVLGSRNTIVLHN